MKRKFVFAHMKVARVYASLSTAKRRKVGALLVKNNTPIAIGYNGTKPGRDNCCEDENNVTFPHVIHAEINALNKLRNSSETAKGSCLVMTATPCRDCFEECYNAGIRTFFYGEDYREMQHLGPFINGSQSTCKFYYVDEENEKIYRLLASNVHLNPKLQPWSDKWKMVLHEVTVEEFEII